MFSRSIGYSPLTKWPSLWDCQAPEECYQKALDCLSKSWKRLQRYFKTRTQTYFKVLNGHKFSQTRFSPNSYCNITPFKEHPGFYAIITHQQMHYLMGCTLNWNTSHKKLDDWTSTVVHSQFHKVWKVSNCWWQSANNTCCSQTATTHPPPTYDIQGIGINPRSEIIRV